MPKRSLEFQKLVQILEIDGNNIMKNIKTMWMSMLDPLKKIMAKYDMLLAMIQSNSNSTQVAKVKQNLNGFCEFIWSCLWFSTFGNLNANLSISLNSLVHGRDKFWMVFKKKLWEVYDVVDLESWM